MIGITLYRTDLSPSGMTTCQSFQWYWSARASNDTDQHTTKIQNGCQNTSHLKLHKTRLFHPALWLISHCEQLYTIYNHTQTFNNTVHSKQLYFVLPP